MSSRRIGIWLREPLMPIAAQEKSTAALFTHTGGNAGNLVHYGAILSQIETPYRCFTTAGSTDDMCAFIKESFDLLIIPCANQLGHFFQPGKMTEIMERVKLPIIALGLGCQAPDLQAEVTLSPAVERWIRVIAHLAPEKFPHIGMRGEFSRRFMEKIGLGDHATVIGCPSLFLSPWNDLGSRLRNKMSGPFRRVAALAGQFEWPHLKSIEAEIFRWVRENDGRWIVQAPVEMAYLAKGEWEKIPPTLLARMATHFRGNADVTDFRAECALRAEVYLFADEWKSRIPDFDLVIGPRFHGVMAAIQSGVPAVCVTMDSRSQEMCLTTRVPHIHYSEFSSVSQALAVAFSAFDDLDFDRNRRERAQAYVTFLNGNNIKASPEMRSLAASE